MSGRLTRKDLADCVVGALRSPYAAFKTVEVRRDEADDAVDKPNDFNALFRPLAVDADRVLRGVAPFPEAVDPPSEPSLERKQEILNDPRVQATITRDRAVAQASKAQEEEGEGEGEGAKGQGVAVAASSA